MRTDQEPEMMEPRWASLPPGATLAELKPHLGFLTDEDAELMRTAIEEAFEQIECDEQ